MNNSIPSGECKICGSSSLEVFHHTAKCKDCGVLLYYPYPAGDGDLAESAMGKKYPRHIAIEWYLKSSFYNHDNFTKMVRFAIEDPGRYKEPDVLDYGGGGGQFALVFKSLFPLSRVYMTDINDDSLLDQWKSCNEQIPFNQFMSDPLKFDFIFLCDVFEHLSHPEATLVQLASKLKNGGKIFIDTPKQFWIYTLAKFFSKEIYLKLLRGTVSEAHLQIWTGKSLNLVIKNSGLKISKYAEMCEYTMPPDFYMDNMHIRSWALRLAGRIFYSASAVFVKNKIMCVLSQSA